MPITKITSHLEEIVPGAMCRIRGFEEFTSEIVAVGSEEMNHDLIQ
jgi:hypothetical protein